MPASRMTDGKPIVYVLDPYHVDAISLLQSTDTITSILPNSPLRNGWHKDATGILLRSDTRLTRPDFEYAKTLEVVVKQGVGLDNVDLEAAKEHGVMVCNTPALNSEAVAELTISLALCIARRVCEIDRLVRNGGQLVRSQLLGLSLFEKTIGIVGMGNIGQVVAKKWIGAMSGKIVAYDPFAEEDAWQDIPHTRVKSLEELLDVADVVSLHVPLTNGTRWMIGRVELARMKKTSIFINAARGGIVDEAALLDALKEKRIWGAALDAMDVEPPTLEAYADMLKNENLIMTPHIGASTMENQSRSGVVCVETMLKVLAGEDVPNRVV